MGYHDNDLDFDVNTFARTHFNGGGHKYAAGGISFDSMEVTISRILSLFETLTF